jgi:GNAT superfamily N-acetyltransferase
MWESMAGLFSASTNIIKPSGELIERALDQLNKNPLKNAEIIANLTQLKNDCSISIIDKGSGCHAIASYYMDLPFYNISFAIESVSDLLALISDLVLRHPELKSQPVYGLYDHAVARIIEHCFDVANKITEIKMTVDPRIISEIDFDRSKYRLESLTTDDIVQISHLYSIVTAMEWTPKALEFGPYYGVFNEENLVSIAGVQYATELVAEIGNIVTHFEHRRKNLAYAATKAVVDALRNRTKHQFLCVLADNEPAIRLYEKMGFVRYENLYLLQYYI